MKKKLICLHAASNLLINKRNIFPHKFCIVRFESNMNVIKIYISSSSCTSRVYAWLLLVFFWFAEQENIIVFAYNTNMCIILCTLFVSIWYQTVLIWLEFIQFDKKKMNSIWFKQQNLPFLVVGAALQVHVDMYTLALFWTMNYSLSLSLFLDELVRMWVYWL